MLPMDVARHHLYGDQLANIVSDRGIAGTARDKRASDIPFVPSLIGCSPVLRCLR
ncbi:hypothetical protein [Stenotrophomonas phage CM2]